MNMMNRIIPTVITPTEQKWLTSLKAFILEKLETLIPDLAIRAAFVTDDNLAIWVNVFTHKTYSDEFNYELLEYIGDTVLEYVLPKYIMEAYPTLKESEYSELKRVYADRMNNESYTYKLGLEKYLRVKYMPHTTGTTRIRSDLFEAFIGGLVEVSNRVRPGSGLDVAYELMKQVLEDDDIDLNQARGSYSTILDQIFQRFNSVWEDVTKPIRVTSDVKEKGNVDVQVILSEGGKKLLRMYLGEEAASQLHVIGQGRSYTKKGAMPLANQSALEFLAKMGITLDWAEAAKRVVDLEQLKTRPSAIPIVDQARAKAFEEKYDTIYFYYPGKARVVEGMTIILIGEKNVKPRIVRNKKGKEFHMGNEGIKTVLGGTYVDNDKKTDGKIQLLREYVRA
jgi:ribonuclease-3